MPVPGSLWCGTSGAAEWFVTMTGATFAVLLAEPEMTRTRLGGDDADMPGETIPRAQVEQTVAGLRLLLDQIAEGTMIAGSGTVARLEGAVAALGALLGPSEGSATEGPD